MNEDTCLACGSPDDDTRFGICFDCATKAEANAARRTIVQHAARGVKNALRGDFGSAKIDFTWAVERLTRTGDYRKGGVFDREGYDWRCRD